MNGALSWVSLLHVLPLSAGSGVVMPCVGRVFLTYSNEAAGIPVKATINLLTIYPGNHPPDQAVQGLEGTGKYFLKTVALKVTSSLSDVSPQGSFPGGWAAAPPIAYCEPSSAALAPWVRV